MKDRKNKLLKKNIHLFFLTAIVSLGACSSAPGNQEQASQPNFLLIYTDEMQFSDLGCYGGEIPTPHIDLLAAEGMIFTSAYTTASMCTPSRYSVISGQFPGRCSAPSFFKISPLDEPYNIAWNTWITPDKLSLPRMLSQNGYVTGMSGKWHISELPEGTPIPGFSPDESLDDPGTEAKLKQQQAVYQGLVESIAGFDDAASVVWGNFDGHPVKALRYHNFPWMVKGALTFLENQKEGDKPFFFYFAPTAVHGPGHVADLSKDVSFTPGGRDLSLPALNLDIPNLKEKLEDALPKTRHRYAGMAQTDHVVGLIRKKLEETGQAENTVIIFMADHNIEPGKATSFEKGVHVPMIVYWPGKEPGRSCNALVQNTDVYPTILDAAGINPSPDYVLDGVSMVPLFTDPEKAIREFIFTENGFTRSVTDGKNKYIALRFPEKLVKKMESGEIGHVPSYVRAWPQAHSAIAMNAFPNYFDQDHYYALEDDPYELNNLFKDNEASSELEELKAALEEHLKTFDHPFDLNPIPFLESEAYRKLAKNDLKFDLGSIPWLSRDHGFISWPPEK